MSLRVSELEQVVEELSARLVGAVVQKAFCPLPRLAYLELRVPGASFLLCLCAEPELARLSVAEERFPTPGEPEPFQRWLRQELTGFKLAAATPTLESRVVVLRFEREEAVRELVLELGSAGRLALLGTGGRVLTASVGSAGHRHGAAPGQRWVPPLPMSAEALTHARKAASRLPPAAEGPGLSLPRSRAAEGLVGARDRQSRAELIRRRLALPHRARLKRLDRTLSKVREEAARGPEAEEHRRFGELLAQNLFRIPRGATEVELVEYTEQGPVPVRVPLSSKRGAREEADWRFHQYRRLTRGVEHAQHRLAELEREAAHSRLALQQLEASDDASLLAQLEVLGHASADEGPATHRPFKEYVAHGGQPVWVGRGAGDNDALTFKVAKPFHLWLHARGLTGSHVVVPLERGKDVHQEVLLDAAHLALHHSSGKGEPRGEVSYVPVKFVRKVKGGAPGQVTYSREKSFVIRIEPARLSRLLDSRGKEP